MNIVLPPDSSLREVEKLLTAKQRQIERELKDLELSDPVLLEEAPEPGELGTDAWQADVHAKTTVIKSNLLDLSTKVKHALEKVKSGTYGQCDKCRKQIESERLQIIPTATLCAVCVAVTKVSSR